MSGIVGLWNFDGAPVELSLLQRMTAAIAHRGPDAQGFWTQESVGLASCLLRVTPESLSEVQPVVAAGEAVAVLDGRLDNRDEILAGLQASKGITAASPDSALVLAAYRQHGDNFIARLNGDFALTVFDIRERKLLLARDYLGVRPLYYARLGDAFLFASEIKAILAYPGFPRVPNENALAVFLAQGFSQDARGETLFSGVYGCPPAHMLKVTPQKTLSSRYWSFEKMSPRRATSARDCAEGFRWYFEQAVRRRIRSAHPVAVSVSGGLDSSSVLCVAETIRRGAPLAFPPIFGASFVFPDSSPADEKQFLTEIERMYGVPIAKVSTNPALAGSARVVNEGIWHAEIPLMDAQRDDSHALYTSVTARGARVLLTGDWGDQVLDDHSHLVDLFFNLRFAELRARLRAFPQWMAGVEPNYTRQQFWQDLLRYQKRWLPQWLVRGMRRIRARHHLPAVYSESLQRRAKIAEWQKTQATSGFASFHALSLGTKLPTEYYFSCFEEFNKVTAMHAMEIAFPYVDRDVVGFVMELPPEVYSAGAVPRALLRQGLRGAVPDAILDRRGKGDFTNHLNEIAQSQFAGMALSSGSSNLMVKHGFVKQELLGHELDQLNAEIRMSGATCKAALSLQKLCRLELWLQTFFGEE